MIFNSRRICDRHGRNSCGMKLSDSGDVSRCLTVKHSDPSLMKARHRSTTSQTLSAYICFGSNPKTEYDPRVTQESGGMIVVFDLALFSCLKYEIYTAQATPALPLHLTLICSAALKSVASLAEMNLLGITVVLVGLVGVWAQHNVLRPLCDSPEAEEAALVAQDYLNSQHTHGYKYALNRIEDIKIYTTVG